jgi:hypothetical protein
MNPRYIASCIYQATVQGISGANQNNGSGYELSAIAELWNIRGDVNNPNSGRTKITNRYKGMGVTEDMILSVVSQYPHGLSGITPTFDELLGVGATSYRRTQPVRTQPVRTQPVRTQPVRTQPVRTQPDRPQQSDDSSSEADLWTVVIYGISFVICIIYTRFVRHWWWIISILVSLFGACFVALPVALIALLVLVIKNKRR